MARAAKSPVRRKPARVKKPRKAAAAKVAPSAKPRAGSSIKVTPALVAAHGLTPEEYQRIRKLIGRTPSFTELGIFSAMWNEHCSYKSSKIHLRTLPTQAPWVIQRSEEHTSELQSRQYLVCRLLLEKKKNK